MSLELRAVVADDEQPAREELCFLLGQVENVKIVGQADNGVSALEVIGTLEPQVAFLDIQMPGLTGFEVANLLLQTGSPAPSIVFVTAYDQYAIDAFEVNAVDYLLKPVEQRRLEQAVERVRTRLSLGQTRDSRIDHLVRMMADRTRRRDQLALRVGDRFLLVQADEVIHASVDGDTIVVTTAQVAGTSNYRYARRVAGPPGPGPFLARPSIAPREHQQDQGDSPLVQQELHAQDEGREGHGDPGQPVPDQAAPGLPEAVDPGSGPIGPETAFARPYGDPVASGDAPGAQAPTSVPTPAYLPMAPVEPPSNPASHRSASARRWAIVRAELVAWVRTLGSAAVYATLIVTFGFQVARVEGLSMAPTLQDQDRLIVNKAVYKLSSPGRGDIVMLYYPVNPDKSFVKRVIAEEGDTVKITDGRVFVNDLPLDDSYVPPEYRSHDDWGPQVIPDGYYFVMGDHRNNSSDSRHWGMVPKRYIIGRVQVRWWPIPEARLF